MIDINDGGFKQHLGFFTSECESKKISNKAESFSKSKGDAITSINDCLNLYNDFCSNFNNVYSSTKRYLEKAYYNINACEESNC